MAHFIGIDGGGTGCRLRIVDAAGRPCAEATAGPANIALDPPGALAQIRQAALQAAAGLSADPAALLAQSTAVLGLAGANVAGTAAQILPRLPFGRSEIVSDAVTTLRGALGDHDGVVAAIGTGSVFASRQGGRYRQIGGWGFLLGDEGSGGALGKELLSEALRAADGIAPPSGLLSAVIASLGGIDAVVPFALSASSADFARLAPQLFDSRDPAAERILTRAEAYIGAAIDRLGGGQDLPVCWIGGLGGAWAKRLAARWPRLSAQGNALDGAVLMARGLAPWA